MLRFLHSRYLKRSALILYFLFLVFSGYFSYSQNETKKWLFGSAAGLDFVTNPAIPITTSSMFGYREGTASVADAFGNLLFYTDGETIWGKTNQVMANGSGLFGDYATTQAALIVKQPGTSNIYFVFTIGYPDLCYSIVDMSLVAGTGSVTVKNVPLASPTGEKLTGTKHCNGTDVWVVTHDFGSNVFRSHLVTAAGVSSSATLSPIGNVWTSRYQRYGAAKISQNGKKLGCAMYHGNPNFGDFEIYDFDNSTGAVSNQVALTIPLTIPPKPPSTNPSPPNIKLPNPDILFPFGCEFSPDGSKFYGSGVNDTAMYQWDLCAGSATAIVNSRYRIKSYNTSALQIAKDGKIYTARWNKQVLGVINSPNLAGAACNYVAAGQSIAPAICSYGLPNFISEPPLLPFSYVINGSVSCNTATFVVPAAPSITVAGCSSTGYNANSFVWYFGDPASGVANTSTLSNPVHTYPGQGTYTANLVYRYTNACGGQNTDTLKQEVKIGVLPLVSTSGYNLCTGDTLILRANGGQTYSWNTGASTASISISPSTTTTYTVSGIDLQGCPYISIQKIDVYTSPTLAVTGPTVICPGFQIKLKASGANTYSWSSGAMQPLNVAIQWAPSVTYTVFGNSNGCIRQQATTVILKRPDVLISGGNVTVCPGTPVTLTVTGTVDYAWSTGASGGTVVVTPTATTIFSVQGMDAKSCINTDSTLITIQRKPALVEFSYISPVCERTPILDPTPALGFDTGGVYSSYDLQVNSKTGQLDLSSAVAGTYFVNYNFPRQSCLDSASSVASVTIFSSPPLELTPALKITPGSTVALHVNGGTTYSWSPEPYLSCANCPEPVASPPETMQFCVTSELESCISKACVNVSVTCEVENDFSVPNAFTPNGDGRNDQFCLRGWNVCLISFHAMIYDQWGEKVFEASEPDFCWDGTYNGKQMNAGVFVCVLSAKLFDKTSVNRKVNISLIR